VTSAATAPDKKGASAATSLAGQKADSNALRNDGSGEEKKEDGDEKLTPEMVDLLVADLRYQTAYYMEVVQAMMDGTTLGAEQVQDKRLELLESPPAVDASTVLLTVALTLVLEGTVGPAIASYVLRTALRPMTQAMGNALKIKVSKNLTGPLSDLRLYRQRQASVSSDDAMYSRFGEVVSTLQSEIRRKVGAATVVREALNAIGRTSEGDLVAGAKAVSAVQNLPGGTGLPLGADGSPGVVITGAAMAAAARMRLSVTKTHEVMEAELRRPGLTPSQAKKMLSDYRLDDAIDLGVIRDSFQLATEAMIWARLLIDEETKTFADYRRRGEVIPGERGIPYQLTFPPKASVDTRLATYLLGRLRRDIERWALETDAPLTKEIGPQGLRLGAPRTADWSLGSLQQEADKVDLLVRYLSSVAEATPEFRLLKS